MNEQQKEYALEVQKKIFEYIKLKYPVGNPQDAATIITILDRLQNGFLTGIFDESEIEKYLIEHFKVKLQEIKYNYKFLSENP